MLSFQAAWAERETKILWKNTGGKDCSPLKRLAGDAKRLLYGLSFTLCRCVPEASFPAPLSSGVSSFQEGKNLGDKYLAWQETASCAFGEEQSPWAFQEPPPPPILLQLLWGAGLGVPQCAKRPAEGLGPEPRSLLLGVNVPAFRV